MKDEHLLALLKYPFYYIIRSGFGKTPARVDKYFALKKVEADWALEWARPAGLKAPGRPAWAPSGPFRLHLLRAGSSPYYSS